MKKLALIFGISVLVVACHTKEPQNQSGINDPVNLSYGDADSSVLTTGNPANNVPKKALAPTGAMESASQNAGTGCIDSSKIDPHGVCTMDYKPVCGCDGKTYSNACKAEKAGVTQFTEGECGGVKKEETKTEAQKPAETQKAPAKKAEPAKEDAKKKKKKK